MKNEKEAKQYIEELEKAEKLVKENGGCYNITWAIS